VKGPRNCWSAPSRVKMPAMLLSCGLSVIHVHAFGQDSCSGCLPWSRLPAGSTSADASPAQTTAKHGSAAPLTSHMFMHGIISLCSIQTNCCTRSTIKPVTPECVVLFCRLGNYEPMPPQYRIHRYNCCYNSSNQKFCIVIPPHRAVPAAGPRHTAIAEMQVSLPPSVLVKTETNQQVVQLSKHAIHGGPICLISSACTFSR
jgi:hypothetical protein